MTQDERIAKLMQNLDLTEEEAQQLMLDDARIDKGEKLFELSDEQKQASKKARQGDRKKTPTAYKFEKKERKANSEKAELIQKLIAVCGEDVEVLNPEREFQFIHNGMKYKITLSCPRKQRGLFFAPMHKYAEI